MLKHKIAFVWGADANFGLLKRDLDIADELVKAKKETGYPEKMRMNYAKNNFENVFAIVEKFKECEFDRIGATLSFQSMSSKVLENIGRTNVSLDFYKNLLTEYNNIVVETNTLSREMWIKSTAFYYMVKALHGNGLVRAFAIYLFYEMGIAYEKFYDGFMTFWENNPLLFTSKLYSDLIAKSNELSLGITNRKLLFEPGGDIVWDDHEYVVLHVLSQIDKFYEEMLPYLKKL